MAETKPEGIPGWLAQGFSLAERATFIEIGLRVMGLTEHRPMSDSMVAAHVKRKE